MFKLVAVCSGVFGLVFGLPGGDAFAQSTSTCMAMGPNMVHCDTMNMAPPASMATPESPPSTYTSDYEGQRLLGKAVHNLIFGDQEKAFRMKIGKMLADGHCRDAGRLALESGRLELGQSIMETCQPSSSSSNNIVLNQPQVVSRY